MLDALESRIVAVAGDRLSLRTDLTVTAATGAQPSLAADNAALRIGIATMQTRPGFNVDTLQMQAGPPPGQQRVLGLGLTLDLALSRRAPGPQDNPDLAAGRAALLADIAAVGHMLADPAIRDGSAFAGAAPDPGFRVLSLALDGGTVTAGPVDGLLSAGWTATAEALVWPVRPPEEVGVIGGVDVLVAGQPLRLSADRPRLLTGETATITLSGLPASRLDDTDTGARTPLALAVRVISDLPLAARGSVAEGDPGADTGVRIVAASDGGATLTYTAPDGPLGQVGAETVAVHVATAEGTAGLLLGGITLGLRQGASE